ncbi:GNAT family N-acetyltransferase [Granulosicoccaceae sp. 1_MG-2023]|nr:GNAT family N-acetyltransferase [Granulosicoccaceae sp. 1_MG-2023]
MKLRNASLRAYLREHPWALRFVRVRWFRHKHVLRAIEHRCFAPAMRSDDTKLWRIANNPGIWTYLIYDGPKPVGYICGMPLEHPNCPYDPVLDPPQGWQQHNTLYIDNIAIVPEYRGTQALNFMFDAYTCFVNRKGYSRCTAHARRANGLSLYLQRRMGFECLAHCRNWCETGEDFDYLRLQMTPQRVPGVCAVALSDAVRRLFAGSVIERRFRRSGNV